MLLAKRIEELEKSLGNGADLITFASWDMEDDELTFLEFNGTRYVQPAGVSRMAWLEGVGRIIAPKVKRQTYLWIGG
jgi:hypothetical protein